MNNLLSLVLWKCVLYMIEQFKWLKKVSILFQNRVFQGGEHNVAKRGTTIFFALVCPWIKTLFQRKRKRRIPGGGKDPDSVSICSLDLDNIEQPETKKKKLPRYLSIYLSVFIYLSIYLSFHLSIYPSILSVCLTLSNSVTICSLDLNDKNN